MNMVLGLTYEVESWMNVDEALKHSVEVQKYATTHVKTNWLKLFMDGTVEGGTGYVEPLYPDGHQGLANWTEEELTDITRKTNVNGITMHIHCMGNKAVNTVVSAYANGGKDELRNTLVHVRNVNPKDYKRMADHNMYVTSGMLWHNMPTGASEILKTLVPAGMEDKSYPMKSYFDNGIPVTSHSDHQCRQTDAHREGKRQHQRRQICRLPPSGQGRALMPGDSDSRSQARCDLLRGKESLFD